MTKKLGENTAMRQNSSDVNFPAVTCSRGFSLPVHYLPNTAVPAVVDGGADAPIELGVIFKPTPTLHHGDSIYKSASNTWVHIRPSLESHWTRWQAQPSPERVHPAGNRLFTQSPWQSRQQCLRSLVPYDGRHESVSRYFFFATSGVSAPRYTLSAKCQRQSRRSLNATAARARFPQHTSLLNYWVDVVFTATAPSACK